MVNEIINNPYRVLGVYSNSPKKEQIANKGKLQAFLKVGQNASFPLDLTALLPPLNRTEEMVQEAESQLTLPQDQVKHAQFWFIKEDSLDEEAFNHLIAGNITKARVVWNRKDSVSSLQNRVVCALIKEDYSKALSFAEKLYSQFTDSFVAAVAGNTLRVDNLGFEFLDYLVSEVGAKKLLPYISNSNWKQHLIIDILNEAIDTAKASRGKGSIARYDACFKLINDSRSLLPKLCEISQNDKQYYKMIVDKLVNEILQSSIDYYNDSEDRDAANKTLGMLKFAQSIAINGSVTTKDQCKEALFRIESNLLMSLIRDFAERKNEDKADQNAGNSANRLLRTSSREQEIINQLTGPELPDATSEINELLNKSRPLVISIKENASSPHDLTKVSEILANVIMNMIADPFNKAQAILGDMAKKLKTSHESSFEQTGYNKALNNFKNQISSYWSILSELELLPLSEDFIKNRIEPNKQTLVNIGKDLQVYFPSVDYTLYYTDDEFFDSCDVSSYSSFVNYLARYPDGKHANEARLEMRDIELREYKKCVSKEDFESFIGKYPKSEYVVHAKKSIDELEYKSCKTYKQLMYFVWYHKDSAYHAEAKRRVLEIEAEAYNACQTFDDYVRFIKGYPNSELIPQAKCKRDQILREIEAKAYNACQSYEDYIEFINDHPISSLIPQAKIKTDRIRQEIESKLRTCQTVQDCIYVYQQYGSDPEQMIDKRAYSLCNGKSDLKLYLEVFSYYSSEAQDTITKSNQRIVIAIIAVIVILAIVIIASQIS